jgi:hypothetical protein
MVNEILLSMNNIYHLNLFRKMNHYDLSRYQCMKQLFDQPTKIEAMEEK